MANLLETRYRLAVCPHGGGRETAAWAGMVAYLRRRVGAPLVWRPAVDFLQWGEEVLRAAVVYADPARGLVLADKHGFVPVAASTDVEGAFLVTRRGGAASLEAAEGARVAVVPGTFATALGLYTLYRRGLHPQPVPAASWQQAMRWVLSGECALGVLCEATYRMLALRTLRALRVVAGPWNAAAAHVWLVRRAYPTLGQRLEEALLAMGDEAEGRDLLAALGVTGWRRPASTYTEIRHILTQAKSQGNGRASRA